MKRKVEVWAVVDAEGYFLAGPSNSRSEVENDANRGWPVMAGPVWKATKFVPHDPLAAGVVRAAVRFSKVSESVSLAYDLCLYDLNKAIEKYQRKGAKK